MVLATSRPDGKDCVHGQGGSFARQLYCNLDSHHKGSLAPYQADQMKSTAGLHIAPVFRGAPQASSNYGLRLYNELFEVVLDELEVAVHVVAVVFHLVHVAVHLVQVAVALDEVGLPVVEVALDVVAVAVDVVQVDG
jgi:hypothetical protein